MNLFVSNKKQTQKQTQIRNKTETESQTQRKNLWLPQGKGGGGIDWEIGIDMYTLLYLKQITNKDLLYSTGNSAIPSLQCLLVY